MRRHRRCLVIRDLEHDMQDAGLALVCCVTVSPIPSRRAEATASYLQLPWQQVARYAFDYLAVATAADFVWLVALEHRPGRRW